ncbi:MAG: hypothetical protein ABIP75_19475, partial [Pyrinomonadaceae bacterium]
DMRIRNMFLALGLVVAVALGCNSLFSKMNAEVKTKAEKVAKFGKYRVLRVTRDNSHNTQGCECASKVAIVFDPIEQKEDQQNFCVSSSASNVGEYDSLEKGDVVSFEVSESLLDMNCSESPSSFLKVKK